MDMNASLVARAERHGLSEGLGAALAFVVADVGAGGADAAPAVPGPRAGFRVAVPFGGVDRTILDTHSD